MLLDSSLLMTLCSFEIRDAQATDIADCVRLRGKTRENAVSTERLAALGITVQSWSNKVKTGELIGVVGQQGQEMVGYCFGHTQTGEVVVLALLPQAEGQGLGKALLARTVSALAGHGHTRLFLGSTRDPATRSHGFYRHLGWTPTGEIDGHDDEILEIRVPSRKA